MDKKINLKNQIKILVVYMSVLKIKKCFNNCKMKKKNKELFEVFFVMKE